MENISNATKKNWNKLNVDETKKKLEHRANKTMSMKRIIPKELFKNRKNQKIIKEYLEYINDNYTKNDLEKIMRTFCIRWLIENELLNENFEYEKNNIKIFLKENNDIFLDVFKFKLPKDEDDILGIIYQCLQNEGDKNKQGSYYTPETIVKNMISQMDINSNTKILDPCCGTGVFLCKSELEDPTNLWGVDIDKIAVLIAKTNLMVKYKENDFIPNIFAFDFLENDNSNIIKEKFDYIITNPPWGADVSYISSAFFRQIRSKESFSYMIVKSKEYLKKEGKIIFLLPESFLNVKLHCDIREYLLKRMRIEKITLYPNSFSGVLTKFISIKIKDEILDDYKFSILDYSNDELYTNTVKEIEEGDNYIIPKLSEKDKKIIKKVYSGEYNTLKNSIWALGIVTGDNEGKIKKFQSENLERIYTGKDITEYRLLPAKNYIEYKRDNFQQVAPDRIYRAEEKLVYKFISKKLVFAYDSEKSLFLNSANILIPNIDGMSIKTCLAFLNSNLFKFVYMKLFGEIKILKGNLEKLPFPVISKEEDIIIENMVSKILQGDDSVKGNINLKIYEIFGLLDDKDYIEKNI